MMKKQKQLSPKIQRQLEILSKYYDIDFENRLINLELVYDKVSEMMDDNIVATKKMVFKNEILQRVSEILDTFPLEFKVNLCFKIDDYEGYEPEDVADSFKDCLEMFHYSIHREKSYRLLEAVILALVSVGILFLRKFALDNGVIGNDNLTSEMLDITAWVFLWQAVTVLFLTPNEYREVSFKILTRLNVVSLYKKDKLLKEISQDEIQLHWVQISRAEKNSRRMMIIAGAFTFATGVMSAINAITSFIGIEEFSWVSLASFLFALLISGFISILGGIGAISVYREKGPFQKLVPFCAYFYLVTVGLLVAAIVALGIESGSFSFMIGMLAMFIVYIISSLLYFISYRILKHVKKVSAKKNA